MREFDVSKDWTILAPTENLAARELARLLGELRGKAIPIVPADAPAPPETTPVIVLNAGDSSNGFSWRAGEDRVEIYGDSPKGLLNGAYDFLSALGFAWEAPGGVRFPRTAKNGGAPAPTRFPLARSGAYQKASDGTAVVERARGEAPADAVRRAAWAKADAVRLGRRLDGELWRMAGEYGLVVEADGPRAGSLLPKLLFPFRPDLFRMERGRRRTDLCFCPTNPKAAAAAARRAARYFRRFPHADAYRFAAAGSSGRALCSCPACRAFTPAEQAIMAANAVAAGLAEASPDARLVLEIDIAEDAGSVILPRANLLLRRHPPDADQRPRGRGTRPNPRS